MAVISETTVNAAGDAALPAASAATSVASPLPIQLTIVVSPQPLLPAPAAASTAALPASEPTIHSAHIHTCAPWVAGRMFSVVPSSPLVGTGETDETWYTITKGRFVGVTSVHALDQAAIIRVSGAAHKGYTTQAAALRAFNLALEGGYVAVVPTA
ncbi:hypothetical protein B0H13DRAFT_2339813 [Mycena leptocephala]|nr:hypothetical protein B0H13DRAFT_2339813 [Mycena leptocephala]